MRKFSLKLIILVIIIVSWPILLFAEQMLVKKIILAHFNIKSKNVIDLPASSPYWPQVDKDILSVDDLGRIYVLNLWNNEIIVFDSNGSVRKRIKLEFKLTRAEYQNGSLQVSGDGKRFLVDGYNENKKAELLIFDENGKVIKQFPKEQSVINFPDARLCDRPYFMFQKGSLLYDKNFNLLKEKFIRYSDLEGSSYKIDLHKHLLIKNDKQGNKLWEKQFDGNFWIIGIESKNNIYIEGRLRKNDAYSLYKLNSEGDTLAQAPIPDPFPFLTKEEKEEWDNHASEESLSFLRLACNGDVYLIYQLGELPKLTFQRWLKGGEYFIYKFETKK